MEKLKNDIKQIVESLGYILYDIVYEKRDNEWVLSVQIDAKSGIDIDDCVRVSESVNTYLDDTDPIDEAYGLEVTSAGAERTLRTTDEIKQAIGKFVRVETIEQIIEGTLEKANQMEVVLRDKNKKTITILQADIEHIRLAIDF